MLLRIQSDAEALRRALPDNVYLWVNAFKSEGPGYYEATDIERLKGLDPLFELNAVSHRSLGEPCSAGADAISVNGDGDVTRCHFVSDVVGNLYRDDIAARLAERRCPRPTCGCYIGYVHLEPLGARRHYGDGLMERVPTAWPRPRPPRSSRRP